MFIKRKNQSLKTFFTIFLLFVFLPVLANSKGKTKKEKTPYKFKTIKQLKATSVKSQGRTGTCWDFATISFLESEALRIGKDNLDLSEMFIARNAYVDKAKQFIYMHGAANFGQGGQAHDVIDQIRKHGIVPEKIYPGMLPEQKKHNHNELFSILNSMVKTYSNLRNISPVWLKAFNSILDVYFGKLPDSFQHKGKSYTPKTFFEQEVGLNLDDYIEITSYTHHPFYTKIRLEIPDNWSYNSDYYNIPMKELYDTAYNAIMKGYTVCWDADISEKYFSKDRMGIALIPNKDWEDLPRKERMKKIEKPLKEKTITQEMRQKTFEEWKTTDDHLMHIIGIAKDQNNNRYFIIKNSWGKDNKYKGYYYISEAYFKLKTIAIMINKNSLDTRLKDKLGI
jgi:bleomycin hydrolase